MQDTYDAGRPRSISTGGCVQAMDNTGRPYQRSLTDMCRLQTIGIVHVWRLPTFVCKQKVMHLGHMCSPLAIVCRKKTMQKWHVCNWRTLYSGYRQGGKATLNVRWPLCRPKSIWEGIDWCLLIVVCRLRKMFVVHAQWKHSNVQKPWSVQAVHGRQGPRNMQDTAHTGNPRLTLVDHGVHTKGDVGISSPTTTKWCKKSKENMLWLMMQALRWR